MIDKLNIWTCLVILGGIIGMCFLAYFGVPTDVVVGYGAAFTTLAGLAKGLFDK